jgi:hypothetical protein
VTRSSGNRARRFHRCALAFALALAIAAPGVAFADQTAVAGNELAAVQILDDVTTQMDIHRPGHYECDPFARPFVHDLGTSLVASALINIALRAIFRHSPAIIRLFAGADLVATSLTIENLRR